MTAESVADKVAGELTPRPLVKLVYSVGQTIESGYLVIAGFIFFYYTAVLGLSGSLVGTALGLSMVLDSVMDPLIGSVSDNIRSKLGRRLPMMLAGAPLTALALIALLSPPPGLNGLSLFLWLVGSKAAFRGAASVFNLPYAALGAEMAGGYVERASIAAYRAIMGNVAALAITAVALGGFFAGEGGLQIRAHYPPFGVAMGVVMLVAGLVATAGVWAYARRLPQPTTAPHTLVGGLASGLPEVFRNGSFRSLFACNVLFWIAAGLNGALGNHAYTFVWKMRPEQIQYVSYSYYAAILLGVPVARMALARLEKKTVLLLGLAGLIGSFTFVHGLRAAGLIHPTGETAKLILMVNVLFAGLGVALLSVTAPAMMADAADEHEMLFGHRREGLYFAGLGFAAKAASGLGQVAAGFALDALRFPKAAGLAVHAEVPEHVLRLLILAWGPLAALFAVGAGLALAGYHLSRSKHGEMAVALRRKREAEAAGA